MTGRVWIALVGMAAAAALAPATATATTWGVPGTGSNVCTIANPNCNTIAQAVTASSNGDTISIGAGSFAVPSSIALTKTLTITGAGIGVTFVQPTSTAFSVRTSGIVFSDFTLQNGATGIAFQSAASNNTQITRVQFSGQTSRGIDVSLAATFPVTNVAITDCQFAVTGIAIRTSSTAQVAGVTISGTSFTGGTYGLYVANDNSTSRFSGLTVQNSSFTNVGGGGNQYAIYAEEMRDVVIEDSTFTGGRSSIGLLKFYGSSGVAASNITIRRNTFSGFTGNALDLEVYLGGATPGVGLENPITVEDNTFQKDVSISISSPAIFLRLPPALTNAAVSILDNDISLSGTFGAATQAHGIQLRGNGPVVITGNTIDGGNVGGTGTSPPSSGIYVQSQASSTSLPSGTFSNVMPATVSISASCNRIQGFRNGVSVFDSIANAYGGLQIGATVTLTDNAILGNDDGVVTAAAPPTIAAENNYWGCPAGPTDGACDGVTGDVDADPFLAAIAPCVACATNAECDDGLFCTGAETCDMSGACLAASDPCIGGPDCENVCNEAADDCIVPAGTVCRASAGSCDVQETCTGLGGSCPADAKSTAVCRAAGGVCDVVESCDGVNDACPADVLEPATTVCRAASGGETCDAPESCTGLSPVCPADAVEPNTTVCRAAAGTCDVTETCDGAAKTCPADALLPTGTSCRTSAGACDTAEVCDGVAALCPSDAKSTAVCRAASGVCDIAESCDGVGNDCPSDGFVTDGTNCDDALYCNGTQTCTGGVCGGGTSPCGMGESCDETGNVCFSGDCPVTPASCLTAAKNKVLIKNNTSDDSKDKLVWKWAKGAATSLGDFSDPVGGTATYALCFYAGATPALIEQASVPPAGGKWAAIGSKGYKYSDSGGTSAGITKIIVKSGASGKSKVLVKGKGVNLPDFDSDLPIAAPDLPLVVQLRNSQSGLCWGGSFATPKKNLATQFNAK